MTWICVANPKGGCGKSTLATQLSALLSASGRVVGLYDADPQGSSLEWASQRAPQHPPVNARAVTSPNDIERGEDDFAIIDTSSGPAFEGWVAALREDDLWLVPVLASPIDLAAISRLSVRPAERVRYGAIASRVNPQTLGWSRLQKTLRTDNWPLMGWLRDTQQYLHAMQEGLGLLELAGAASVRDRMQWQGLMQQCFPQEPELAELVY